MTEELKELGLEVGHRRVGRLMRQNNIPVIRTRKHKVTTDSHHKFNVAPELLKKNLAADCELACKSDPLRWVIAFKIDPLFML